MRIRQRNFRLSVLYAILLCTICLFSNSQAFSFLPAKTKVRTVEFSLEKFKEPDSIYWPGYFWWWNGRLEPEILIEQLRDMRAHDARSVCALAMPYEFRPTTMNNQMDVKYLSDEYFERVKIAVEEASRLGMNYWLYDEGGWPSGEACGQLTDGHAELLSQIQSYDSDKGIWEIKNGKGVDRLNSRATQRFINLTHEKYKEAVGKYFGSTIKFAFTDEPSIGKVVIGRQMPWTDNFGKIFKEQFGYRAEDYLYVFTKDANELTQEDMKIRIDFFDCWPKCFADSYFLPIRDWCRRNGIMAGGHLDNEDKSAGAIECGYGNILRQLRAEDLPGVDAIWRQIFRGQKNHYFPLLAASAAHQIGSPYAFTESFVVYGNGLTPEEMKWVTDYQYVRGINLMVAGSYPVSTEEHLMSGLRPHFGPVNPMWDFMPVYHGYTARLGYTLSSGKPKIDTAVFLPIRDLWAEGTDKNITNEFDGMVEELLRNQCSFDFVDDDILADKEFKIQNGKIKAGAVEYSKFIFYQCSWMKKESVERLAEFVKEGGQIYCVKQLPAVNNDRGELFKKLVGEKCSENIFVFDSVEELAAKVDHLIYLEPAGKGIRVMSRDLGDERIYFLFNEGEKDYKGKVIFNENKSLFKLEPKNGRAWVVETEKESGKVIYKIDLTAGGSELLYFGQAEVEKNRIWKQVESINLAEGWQTRRLKKYDVGKSNYQINEIEEGFKAAEPGRWDKIYTKDFSGSACYKISVPVKKEWQGRLVQVDLGKAEYAAEIRINGEDAGKIVWGPWKSDVMVINKPVIDLEIAVYNTLANVLVSERVRNDWANRNVPGWPGNYDARTAEFEKESVGGGLIGPVKLEIGYWK